MPVDIFEDERIRTKEERVKDRITYLRDSKELKSLERDGKGRSRDQNTAMKVKNIIKIQEGSHFPKG